MKKLIIIPFIVLALASHAQLEFGIKAGANVSNFTGGNFNDIEKTARVGFHGGGLLRFHLGKLVIQPELLFSSQGAKLSKAGNETEFKLDYVNIPVLLQYQFKGGLYAEFGPQFGFKVSENVPDSMTVDFAKNSDVSALFGLGYITKISLGIAVRYCVGISKVGDFSSANIDPNFKNGVLQFSLFYLFFHKKEKKS